MTDPGRRDALVKAKARALARTRWSAQVERARDGSLPGGAALVAGDTAWALAEDEPGRSLGPALAWARKAGATTLHLMAARETGALARRATAFGMDVHVGRIDGVTLAEAAPEPLPPEPPLDPAADAFRGLLERAGTEAVVEQGILRAELLGLEVARVVPDADDGGAGSGGSGGGVHLEVGVGRHDRAMHREIQGPRHGMDELFEVVRAVAERRRPGGEGHDAYHLAAERWLRAVVVRKPELVGAAQLDPMPSPVVRADLRRAAPAPARGVDRDGRPMLVVCSVGLDLDLVSAADDSWQALDDASARFVLCLPVNDAYPAVRDLAALHLPPAEVVTVPPDWRSL